MEHMQRRPVHHILRGLGKSTIIAMQNQSREYRPGAINIAAHLHNHPASRG